MKIKLTHVLILGAILLLASYMMGWWTWEAGEIKVEEREEIGLVSVTKPVDFYLMDSYAGGGIDGGSNTLDVYDTDMVLLEQLDPASDGTIATSAAYPSGTVFNVQYNDGGTPPVIMWFNNIVVPKMTPADAESLTVNGPIMLKCFDYTEPTVTVRDNLGNSYSDGGDLNATSGDNPGTDTFTLVVDLSQGTDNDGFIGSYDPIYDIELQFVVVLKIDSGGYETISISGYDGSIEKGSAMYYWRVVPDIGVSRWVSGTTVRQEGATSVSFSWDMSSYGVDTANLDVLVYAYANPNYFMTKGSWGPDSDQCGSTIDLDLFYSI